MIQEQCSDLHAEMRASFLKIIETGEQAIVLMNSGIFDDRLTTLITKIRGHGAFVQFGVEIMALSGMQSDSADEDQDLALRAADIIDLVFCRLQQQHESQSPPLLN